MAHPASAGAALSDTFLGKIYRATSDEARRLSLALDEADRARLALFCNGKAHLRGHGRAIATACTLESLISEAGQAGRILFDQAGVAPDKWGVVAHLPKQISLGGAKLNAALTTSR